MARPIGSVKYDDTFPGKARKLAATEKYEYNIAKKLGISRDTYSVYKKNYSDFSDAIKEGLEEKRKKDVQKVENSLLKRANGFSYIETTEEYELDTKIRTKKVKKTVLPDPVSIMFFLKNRDPENWKDKQKDDNVDSLDLNVKIDYGDN